MRRTKKQWQQMGVSYQGAGNREDRRTHLPSTQEVGRDEEQKSRHGRRPGAMGLSVLQSPGVPF